MKRLTIRGTAISLGLFFDVSFVLCVVWGLLAPAGFSGMRGFLEAVVPGFVWLTPASFFLGLAVGLLYGVYIAVVFVPLFNYFEAAAPETTKTTPAEMQERRGAAVGQRDLADARGAVLGMDDGAVVGRKIKDRRVGSK